MSTSLQKQSRRAPWPTLQLLTPSMSSTSKSKSTVTSTSTPPPPPPPSEDIDEDPFSHFLSPVMDEDDPFDGLEYSAGIHTFDDEVETKRTKFRARLEEKWGNFLSSRRSTSPTKETSPPRTPPDEDALPELVLDDLEGFGSPSSSPPNLPTLLESPHESEDGWAADRRRLRRKNNFNFDVSKPKLERPRSRRLKTLSGRPHSFMEPAPHLWTVEEGEEEKHSRPDLRSRRWSRA